MFDSYLTVLLAILGLGFLVFIHELGHYFAARYVGMKVEAFGIGFGQALYKWNWQGTEWRLNWLPFGGYVKIAGMESKKGQDSYKVPGGFYSKSPWQSILVSLAGPIVNLVFALLVFTIIWGAGGRVKPYAQVTPTIGWVDPRSELYAKGVRPGDEILSYNHHPFSGVTDHFVGPMTAGDFVEVQGYHVNPQTGEKDVFNYKVKPYSHPNAMQQGLLTSGILQPASFVVIQESETLPSGFQAGDRVVWVDGTQVFGAGQLKEILNDDRSLVTIERLGQIFQRRVPRVALRELKLSFDEREELSDWQHEAGLAETKLTNLYGIPYDLSYDGVVERRYQFIDEEDYQEAFPEVAFSETFAPLQEGDRILAVDGTPVKYGYQVLYQLQKKHALVIVERGSENVTLDNLRNASSDFYSIDKDALTTIASSIGTSSPIKSSGNLVLVDPVSPKTQREIQSAALGSKRYKELLAERKREIDRIENSDLKERALKKLSEEQQKLYMGVPVADKSVKINVGPFELFAELTNEIGRNLKALVSGSMSPKWFSGPPGIVQAVHSSLQVSYLEGLFWLGFISLNLGYLNLLPIPVLDGGYIVIFLIEGLTGKKIKPQALERLILPFVIMLLLFMVYLSINDFARIFGGM